MTDQVTAQPVLDKKPTTPNPPPQPGNNRGPKKNNNAVPKPTMAAVAQGRPTSRSSNKKPGPAAESGSDTGKKGNDTRRVSDNRAKGPPPRGGAHKKLPSQGGRPNNQPVSRQPSKSNSSTPVPTTGAETSDALSSLQRVIADLKTTSPAVQPQEVVSNLPPNAPVFQPGMTAYPGNNPVDPRHRKAASMGAGFGNNPNNGYAPNLGVMMEDAEDHSHPGPYEEGEIQDNIYRTQGPGQGPHARRSLSQSFTAPRFAALAAQQESEVVGPTGRPQLAPGFMFGAAPNNNNNNRRRGSFNTTMGPPINEEDLGFQFPQQQNMQGQSFDNQGQDRRDENGGEITGIMAEQVSRLSVVQVSLVLTCDIDCASKTDRSSAEPAAASLPAATGFEPGPILPNSWAGSQQTSRAQTCAEHSSDEHGRRQSLW